MIGFLAECPPPIQAEEKAEPVHVSGTRISGTDHLVRFVVDFSRKPSFYTLSLLPNPYRLVIDIPEASFSLPDGIGKLGHGLIEEYRYGSLSEGKSRFVLDLKAPVRLNKHFILAANQENPARLVIVLSLSSEAAFQKDYRQQLAAQKQALLAKTQISQEDRRILSPENEKKEEKNLKTNQKVIVIDPGHGGIDSGAVSKNGVLEKNIVLKLAHLLKEKIEKTGKYQVFLTRDKDVFLPLKERVKKARQHQADLFIAIHADMLSSSAVRGATVYTLSEKASDREAELLAHKENRSDSIAGVELDEVDQQVGTILLDLAQRETKNGSTLFAKHIVKILTKVTKLTKHPHRSAGFFVLKAPDVPSVLLELGYLSNASDLQLLTSDRWRAKIAEAIYSAVDRYFHPL